MLAAFFDRLRRFGLEGKAILYARDRGPGAGPDALRFVGSEWSDAERVLRQADLLLNFHYAIDPRLLACARRTALVDIDPGLLQFWISTGQLTVAPHPAAGVSRPLALHVRSPGRGVHDGFELVDDRLAQGDRERQDSAARE